MKLSPVLSAPYITQHKSVRGSKNVAKTQVNICDLRGMPYYLSFKQKQASDYERVKEYVESVKKDVKKNGKSLIITDYDFDKLEGIQKGIKVFEGLNIREILFVITSLLEVATLRGCNNACVHCYAEAKAPIKETGEQIAKMDWDDFKSLTDGIKELNDRLGCKMSLYDYQTLFHDADCSKIFIKDKDGAIHNWNEMAKMMYESTGVPQIFDTSGWYVNDKITQKRVENLVEEVLKEPTRKYVQSFMVSVNPFQPMYFKHIENWRAGNKEKAAFFNEKDAERVANTLFTLSPLFKIGKLRLLTRAMSDEAKNSAGFSAEDLRTNYEINYIPKLKKLYEDDFNAEQKVIKNSKRIKDNIQKIRQDLRRIDTDLTATNKLKDIYDVDDFQYQKTLMKRDKTLFEFFSPNRCYTMIDANGDVYVTDFYSTYKSDIQLNFKNKNKKTAPIAPMLREKIISQREMNMFLDQLSKVLS